MLTSLNKWWCIHIQAGYTTPVTLPVSMGWCVCVSVSASQIYLVRRTHLKVSACFLCSTKSQFWSDSIKKTEEGTQFTLISMMSYVSWRNGGDVNAPFLSHNKSDIAFSEWFQAWLPSNRQWQNAEVSCLFTSSVISRERVCAHMCVCVRSREREWEIGTLSVLEQSPLPQISECDSSLPSYWARTVQEQRV